MTTTIRFPRAALIFIAGFLTFAGCGDDDSPTSSGNGTPDPPVAVSGVVTKAPIGDAAVTIHEISATGDAGAQVGGPFTTDAAGAFTGELPAGTTGSFLVKADGGSYTDESTSAVIDAGVLHGVLRLDTSSSVIVSPLSEALVRNVQGRVALGTGVASAIAAATTELEDALRFDPTTLSP